MGRVKTDVLVPIAVCLILLPEIEGQFGNLGGLGNLAAGAMNNLKSGQAGQAFGQMMGAGGMDKAGDALGNIIGSDKVNQAVDMLKGKVEESGGCQKKEELAKCIEDLTNSFYPVLKVIPEALGVNQGGGGKTGGGDKAGGKPGGFTGGGGGTPGRGGSGATSPGGSTGGGFGGFGNMNTFGSRTNNRGGSTGSKTSTKAGRSRKTTTTSNKRRTPSSKFGRRKRSEPSSSGFRTLKQMSDAEVRSLDIPTGCRILKGNEFEEMGVCMYNQQGCLEEKQQLASVLVGARNHLLPYCDTGCGNFKSRHASLSSCNKKMNSRMKWLKNKNRQTISDAHRKAFCKQYTKTISCYKAAEDCPVLEEFVAAEKGGEDIGEWCDIKDTGSKDKVSPAQPTVSTGGGGGGTDKGKGAGGKGKESGKSGGSTNGRTNTSTGVSGSDTCDPQKVMKCFSPITSHLQPQMEPLYQTMRRDRAPGGGGRTRGGTRGSTGSKTGSTGGTRGSTGGARGSTGSTRGGIGGNRGTTDRGGNTGGGEKSESTEEGTRRPTNGKTGSRGRTTGGTGGGSTGTSKAGRAIETGGGSTGGTGGGLTEKKTTSKGGSNTNTGNRFSKSGGNTGTSGGGTRRGGGGGGGGAINKGGMVMPTFGGSGGSGPMSRGKRDADFHTVNKRSSPAVKPNMRNPPSRSPTLDLSALDIYTQPLVPVEQLTSWQLEKINLEHACSGRDNKQNVKECVQENSVACDADSQQNAEDLLPHLVDYLEPYCKKECKDGVKRMKGITLCSNKFKSKSQDSSTFCSDYNSTLRCQDNHVKRCAYLQKHAEKEQSQSHMRAANSVCHKGPSVPRGVTPGPDSGASTAPPGDRGKGSRRDKSGSGVCSVKQAAACIHPLMATFNDMLNPLKGHLVNLITQDGSSDVNEVKNKIGNLIGGNKAPGGSGGNNLVGSRGGSPGAGENNAGGVGVRGNSNSGNNKKGGNPFAGNSGGFVAPTFGRKRRAAAETETENIQGRVKRQMAAPSFGGGNVPGSGGKRSGGSRRRSRGGSKKPTTGSSGSSGSTKTGSNRFGGNTNFSKGQVSGGSKTGTTEKIGGQDGLGGITGGGKGTSGNGGLTGGSKGIGELGNKIGSRLGGKDIGDLGNKLGSGLLKQTKTLPLDKVTLPGIFDLTMDQASNVGFDKGCGHVLGTEVRRCVADNLDTCDEDKRDEVYDLLEKMEDHVIPYCSQSCNDLEEEWSAVVTCKDDMDKALNNKMAVDDLCRTYAEARVCFDNNRGCSYVNQMIDEVEAKLKKDLGAKCAAFMANLGKTTPPAPKCDLTSALTCMGDVQGDLDPMLSPGFTYVQSLVEAMNAKQTTPQPTTTTAKPQDSNKKKKSRRWGNFGRKRRAFNETPFLLNRLDEVKDKLRELNLNAGCRELYQSKWQSCVDHQTEGCDGDVKGQVVSAIDHIRQHMDPYCKEDCGDLVPRFEEVSECTDKLLNLVKDGYGTPEENAEKCRSYESGVECFEFNVGGCNWLYGHIRPSWTTIEQFMTPICNQPDVETTQAQVVETTTVNVPETTHLVKDTTVNVPEITEAKAMETTAVYVPETTTMSTTTSSPPTTTKTREETTTSPTTTTTVRMTTTTETTTTMLPTTTTITSPSTRGKATENSTTSTPATSDIRNTITKTQSSNTTKSHTTHHSPSSSAKPEYDGAAFSTTGDSNGKEHGMKNSTHPTTATGKVYTTTKGMKENDGDHPSSKGPDTGNMNNGQKQALVPACPMECYCSLGCRGNMNTADCMTSLLCESSACDCGERYDVRVNGRCGKYLPDHLCGGGGDGGENKHMSAQGKKGKSSNRQPMIGDYGTVSKAQQTKDSPKEEKPDKNVAYAVTGAAAAGVTLAAILGFILKRQ